MPPHFLRQNPPGNSWNGGCHSCQHSCETSGGVCDEQKEVEEYNLEPLCSNISPQDITTANVCPSLQDCSSCAAHDCQWCSQPSEGEKNCRSRLSGFPCAPEDLEEGTTSPNGSLSFQMGSHDVEEVKGSKTYGEISSWNPEGEVELDLIWNSLLGFEEEKLADFKLALGYQTKDGSIITDGRDQKSFEMKVTERRPECKPGMEDQCRQGVLGGMKSVKYKVLLKQKDRKKCENSEGAQVFQLIRETHDDYGDLERSETKGQVKVGFRLRCACEKCNSLTCNRWFYV